MCGQKNLFCFFFFYCHWDFIFLPSGYLLFDNPRGMLSKDAIPSFVFYFFLFSIMWLLYFYAIVAYVESASLRYFGIVPAAKTFCGRDRVASEREHHDGQIAKSIFLYFLLVNKNESVPRIMVQHLEKLAKNPS